MDEQNSLSLPALYEHLARTGLVRRLIELARDEDLGRSGDRTSHATIGADVRGTGRIVARSAGVVAGLAAAPAIVGVFAPARGVEVTATAADGDRVAAGATIATISGPLRDLLAIERTLLNVLGRLSGVATRTAKFVEALMGGGGGGVKARLYDTRKTTPGLRVLEKYAVRCGGGFCHRVGLYDAVLIKDNHLAGVTTGQLADFVADAARKARAHAAPDPLKFVQVEVEGEAALERIFSLQPGLIDIVLLDNMTVDQMRACVGLRDRVAPRIELEASGGVTLETIRAVGQTGVDRISVGSLTHGATWLDIALDIG